MATYLVTGADKGIGLEYCRQLQQRGDTVIAACRKPSDELKALEVQVESGVDVTSEEAVANLADRLRGVSLDVLINNAGILGQNNLGSLDFDNIRQQFEVNAIGMLRVTQALLPNLKSGSKIAIMTSRMGSLEDNSSGGYYGYRMSKAAVSMAGKSLAIDLKPQKIAVAILHPGMVSTRMTDYSGISAEESVTGLLARIDQLNLETSGTFWHANGQVLPW